MNIQKISVGPYEVNCCILWKEKNKTLVIDPGSDASLIQSYLEANDLVVAAYLCTHGHADHLHALADIYATQPAPIYIHAQDFQWAFSAQNQILPFYSVPQKPNAEFLKPEKPGNLEKILTSDASRFQTLETPGHTPGGVCYWFEAEKVCFTGDTLFKGSCGRTDLPGGDGRTLSASLKKLASLPGETRIIAGHGDETTLAHELKTNLFLR